jgi:hypothetical protein
MISSGTGPYTRPNSGVKCRESHPGQHRRSTPHKTPSQVGPANQPLAHAVSLSCTPTTMDLEGFEDENPFEQDIDHIQSESSSLSKVAIYEPSSPPPHLAHALSPSSPPHQPSFPSGEPHGGAAPQFKTDFCCARDRYLHNSDDFELTVGSHRQFALLYLSNWCERSPMPRRLAQGPVHRTLSTSFAQG